MDIELEQDVIFSYATAGQVTVCQEETQEAIVPDACPDILRIADVCAQAFPSRWEIREGQASVIGFVQATLLYIPEEGRSIQHMEVKLPFSSQADIPGLSPDCTLEVSTRLRCADSRILNPRKVLIRVDLITEITAFQKKEQPICKAAYQADDEKLCQRQTCLDHEQLISIPQRIFSISEEIRFTGTQAPRVLACRGESICTECRIIGNKLIFKGKTDVTILFQSEDGILEQRKESFPLSQILEAKGAADSCVCLVNLELAELVCRPSADDSFRLVLDMEILAQGQVRSKQSSVLLTDLYSTVHHVELEQNELKLFFPSEQQTIPQMLRELLETDDVVRSVCDSRFLLGSIQRIQEEDMLKLTAQGLIIVLYLDESRQLRHMQKTVEISTKINTVPDSEVICRCTFPGELFATPCASGVEVRLNLEFHLLTAQPFQVKIVCHAKQGELRCSNGTRPSIVLRFPEPDEELWDIAKACGTTKKRIIHANELTGEDIPCQKMLLIPSAR